MKRQFSNFMENHFKIELNIVFFHIYVTIHVYTKLYFRMENCMILSLIQMFRAFAKKLRDDHISAFASQSAYFVILSFFPFIMFLLTIINYLPFSQDDVIALTSHLLPDTIHNFVTTLIYELYEKSSGTLLSLSVIAALWSAARGILAMIRGLNSVYGIKETRSYFRLRFISSLYTVGFALFLIISLALLVFGNQILLYVQRRQIPILTEFTLLIISIRTVALLIALSIFFLIIYLVIPNRKSQFFYELPGALLSAFGWTGFSYLFSFYIDNMGNYSYTYGSLTAIIICMLWLYACMYIMFIGAEVNVVLASPNVRNASKVLLSHFRLKRSNK